MGIMPTPINMGISTGMTIRADLAARNFKHGHASGGKETPEFRSWRAMIERCENPNHIGYKYYGARGIKVCERWRSSFADFLLDMGLKPSPKHTLDRYQNFHNYRPGNCRWATAKEQRANQRAYDESARVRAAWVNRNRSSVLRIDMTGQLFGRLFVIGYQEASMGRALWKCRCQCGTEIVVTGKSLRGGNTKSCGCLSREGARERALARNATDNPAKYRWSKT